MTYPQKERPPVVGHREAYTLLQPHNCEIGDYKMIVNTPPKKSKSQLRPRRIRELYAALATAPDENRNHLIALHWDAPTKQMILRQIAAAELDLGIPANDNRRAGQ